MNGQSLLESVAQGDFKAFEEAYLSYRDEFIVWANKNYYCDFEESRDIYQATVIQFYENVRSGRLTQLTSDLKTYLFAIGKNKIREQRESGKRFREMQNQYEPEEGEDKEEREVLYEKAEEALDRLGDPCKRLLELYYYYKKSLAEIAETLAYKNTDTVKNLKYKCLGRLRKAYRQN